MRKQEIRTQPTDKFDKGLKAFPSGLPKPHAARDWGRSIQTAITERGLTDVARKELPPGLFDKLWSADALQEPPELPAGASFGDQLRWRSMRDEVEKRKAHNDLTMEKRKHWWLEKNHEYFVMITDTMQHSAPGLYDTLYDRYMVSTGYYDGCAAMDFIVAWLDTVKKRHPHYEFYQSCVAG